MNLHIITMFPAIIEGYLENSIMKRAKEKGHLTYTLHNLSDWSVRHTRRVDDRPYGGGSGTILMIEPLYNCITYIERTYDTKRKICFMPQGKRLIQEDGEIFAKGNNSYILICGHYEGIDERVFTIFDIEKISVGDFVLSGGELAALVWIDCVTRLIPGVIARESVHEESYSESLDRKKEYPHYTRPREFMGLKVPDILLSGDTEKIRSWRQLHTS